MDKVRGLPFPNAPSMISTAVFAFCADASLPPGMSSGVPSQAGVKVPVVFSRSYAENAPGTGACELLGAAPQQRDSSTAEALCPADGPAAVVTAVQAPGKVKIVNFSTQNGAVTEDGGADAVANDMGLAAPLEPNATMRRELKVQAAAAAIAFNVAYEQKNNTPTYDRLHVTPLRLGSGIAASALPVASAPPPLTAPSLCTASPAYGLHVAASDVVAAAGPGAPAHRVSSYAAACAEKEQGRPQKRRRLQGDDACGSPAGGSFTLGAEFAFVLNRCFNCGSYGHDLRNCKRPRNQTTISTRQREWSVSHGAVVAERRAQQAAAAAQRRGSRHKASHGRYFSTVALGGEDEGNAAVDDSVDASWAECVARGGIDPTQALTRAPPGVRPGTLSGALAAALDLACPLDPPPWLATMAMYGIPPAYCRGPYLDPTAEAQPSAAATPAELPAAGAEQSVAASRPAAGAPGSDSAAGAVPRPPPMAAAMAPADAVHLPGAAHACLGPATGDDGRDVDDSRDTAVLACGAGTASVTVQVLASKVARDDEDLQLLRPLLPDTPCHVLYAGLNAPLCAAACRDRWRRALGRARRAVAFVEAVRGEMRRREQQRQQDVGQAGQEQRLQDPGQQQPQLAWQPQQLQQQGTSWQPQQPQQQQQGMLWHPQGLLWRQQQLQMLRMQQQQFEFMLRHPQCSVGSIPFFFGGPNFQGFGQ